VILRQAPTMPDIKIIALDLDGTLLNSKKELSPGNFAALQRAAAAGIEVVPTTGRFFDAMPKQIRDLPFVNYAITINGAQVYDIHKDKAVATAEMPWEQAVEIMTFLDPLPVLYDCYMNNEAFMSERYFPLIDDLAPNEHYRKMLHELRQPVEELKDLLKQRKQGVQKIQFFTKDQALRQEMLDTLEQRFENLAVSSSVENNVEINNCHAQKGNAIAQLAAYLGCTIENCMACGDGLNDISMIREAGLGVVMENGHPSVKALADYIAPDCDSDGVAEAIYRFCPEI